MTFAEHAAPSSGEEPGRFFLEHDLTTSNTTAAAVTSSSSSLIRQDMPDVAASATSTAASVDVTTTGVAAVTSAPLAPKTSAVERKLSPLSMMTKLRNYKSLPNFHQRRNQRGSHAVSLSVAAAAYDMKVAPPSSREQNHHRHQAVAQLLPDFCASLPRRGFNGGEEGAAV